MSMIIESIIRRQPNGSRITIDGQLYHFKPCADGRHVCKVENLSHVQRFLSITEGYRPAEAADVLAPSDSAPPAGTDTGNGTDTGAGDVEPPQGDSLSPETLGDEGAADEEGNEEQAAEEKPASRDDLVEAFKAKFGRKPHHAWDEARIQKELDDASE